MWTLSIRRRATTRISTRARSPARSSSSHNIIINIDMFIVRILNCHNFDWWPTQSVVVIIMRGNISSASSIFTRRIGFAQFFLSHFFVFLFFSIYFGKGKDTLTRPANGIELKCRLTVYSSVSAHAIHALRALCAHGTTEICKSERRIERLKWIIYQFIVFAIVDGFARCDQFHWCPLRIVHSIQWIFTIN